MILNFRSCFALAIVVAVLGLVLALPAPVAADEGKPAATVGMTNTLKFKPPKIAIQEGETVLWKNTSGIAHTVTADPELARDPEHVHLPEGAKPFNSGTLKAGETFSHTFKVPGRYTYFCIPHELAGMIGEVEVKPRK